MEWTAGALDDLRDQLERSRSSLWRLPTITRDAVVRWADNAPVEWPPERRPDMRGNGCPRPRDSKYARFRRLDEADDIEDLLAWYVRRLIPAAAATEGIAWGVTVYPPGSGLVRVNIGMVETLVITKDRPKLAFVNVRASVIDAALEADEITLRDLAGDRVEDDDAAEYADVEAEPHYRNVGEDHVQIWFDNLDEVRRVLSIPVVARAARLLNAALLPTPAANARRGHTPAVVDRAFPDGQLQPA